MLHLANNVVNIHVIYCLNFRFVYAIDYGKDGSMYVLPEALRHSSQNLSYGCPTTDVSLLLKQFASRNVFW